MPAGDLMPGERKPWWEPAKTEKVTRPHAISLNAACVHPKGGLRGAKSRLSPEVATILTVAISLAVGSMCAPYSPLHRATMYMDKYWGSPAVAPQPCLQFTWNDTASENVRHGREERSCSAVQETEHQQMVQVWERVAWSSREPTRRSQVRDLFALFRHDLAAVFAPMWNIGDKPKSSALPQSTRATCGS